MTMPDTTRQPPCAIDAEQAVIGALLIDGSAVANVHWLRPEDFYREEHRLIYSAIIGMADGVIDVCTVSDRLDELGNGKKSGGLQYLIEVAKSTPSSANVAAYAEIVREKSQLRRLADRGMALANSAYNSGGSGSREIAALAARDLMEMSSGVAQRGANGMRSTGRRWYADLTERLAGGGKRLLTPWGQFNRITDGLRNGDLIFLAGRPGMGKSAAGLGISTCAAAQGKRVMFYSLEMTSIALFNRAAAAAAHVPLEFLRKPSQDGDEWGKIRAALGELVDLPLEIDDEGGLTVDQVVMRAKREHMIAPIDLIVLDHFHLLAFAGRNPEQELAEASKKLKALAKALDCPALVLGQLNRGLELRQNKRPVMSDLRGSGALEQDADLIVFVYRDDYYAQQEDRDSEHPGIVEFIIAKQREGVTGKAYARSALEYGRIDDIADYVPPRAAQKTVGTGFGNYSGSRSRTKQRSDVDG